MTIGLIALDLDGTPAGQPEKTCQSATAGHWSVAPVWAYRLYRPGRAVDGITQEVRSLPGVNYAISTNGGTVADLVKGTNLKVYYPMQRHWKS